MSEQNEQQPKKKKGGALKWTGIGCFGIIALLILLGGCVALITPSGDDGTESSDDVAGSEETSEEETEEETEEAAPEDQEYAVGDTADIDGKQITISNVEKRQAGEFEVVKDGYEFVIVNIEIVNRSDEEINYNPLNFELQDGNGNITDSFGALSLDGVGEQLNSGALAAGGNVSGTVAFEVPQGDEDLTLRYKDNMLSNDTIDFNLY